MIIRAENSLGSARRSVRVIVLHPPRFIAIVIVVTVVIVSMVMMSAVLKMMMLADDQGRKWESFTVQGWTEPTAEFETQALIKLIIDYCEEEESCCRE